MTRAWIHARVLAFIQTEALRGLPNETGGVLIGYRADNGEAVIQEVTGPGPNAMHSSSRFVPDHGWQCDRLDAIFAATNGQLVYLGDWHTHPCGTPCMSGLDRRTLRSIALHPELLYSPPLMLIGGNAAGAWSWKLHEYLTSSLFGFSVHTQNVTIVPFN